MLQQQYESMDVDGLECFRVKEVARKPNIEIIRSVTGYQGLYKEVSQPHASIPEGDLNAIDWHDCAALLNDLSGITMAISCCSGPRISANSC